MELKRNPHPAYQGQPDLLIVPYGIETLSSSIFSEAYCLLIVPYGIETLSC